MHDVHPAVLRRGVSRLVREHQASASGTLISASSPPLDTAFLLLGCKRDLRRDEQVLPDSSQYQRVKARAPGGRFRGADGRLRGADAGAVEKPKREQVEKPKREQAKAIQNSFAIIR